MLQSMRSTASSARAVPHARSGTRKITASSVDVGAIDSGSLSRTNLPRGETFGATVYVDTEPTGEDVTIELLVGDSVVGSYTKSLPSGDEVIGGGNYVAKTLVEGDWQSAFCAAGSGYSPVTARVKGTGNTGSVGRIYVESGGASRDEVCGDGDEDDPAKPPEFIKYLRQHPTVVYGVSAFVPVFLLLLIVI